MADHTIAGEMRAALAREQRSQRWLSEQTGISPTALGRKMRGDTSFTLDELLAISRALGISASSIIEAVESEPSAA